MASIETPTYDHIKSEYLNLPFTQTSGYGHYAPTGADARVRDESTKQFLNDPSVTEPHLDPSRHSWETINQTIEAYDRLLTELAKNPHRSPEEDDLMDIIINKTGELFRYEELLLSLGNTALEERDEHRRLASDLSLEIMGGVNKPAFSTLVNELLDMADKSQSEIASELRKILKRQSVDNGGGFNHVELEDTTRDVVRNDLYELFPGLQGLIGAEDTGPISPSELVEICKKIQGLAGMDEWNTELNDGKSANTSSKDKTVFIGKDRATLKNQREAVALGVHEAIVHGGRAGGVQCAGTLDFEEGLATRLQQIISGERRTPGVQYYLSIGLQAGIDREGEARNYREVFEIMWRREVLLQEKAGKEIDIVEARALAQRQVTRTRRGGAIDTRDSSYFVGAQKAAEWLNGLAQRPTDERKRELLRVLTNRIDPTVPEHILMVEKAT